MDLLNEYALELIDVKWMSEELELLVRQNGSLV